MLLDPLAPPESETGVWERLDKNPPTAIVVLKPDHVRDVDLFVKRHHIRAYGPRLFFRDDIPEAELDPIQPAATFQEESSLSMMDAAEKSLRSGYLDDEPLSSLTR